MHKVELEIAFEWVCPNCQQQNFVSGVIAELDDETKAELSEEYPGDLKTGDFMVKPEEVVCDSCGHEFEVDIEEDDDEDENY